MRESNDTTSGTNAHEQWTKGAAAAFVAAAFVAAAHIADADADAAAAAAAALSCIRVHIDQLVCTCLFSFGDIHGAIL